MTGHRYLHVQGRQFSVHEVEVVAATVDIDEVVSYRGAVSSLQEQASGHQPHPHIAVDFRICHAEAHSLIPTSPREPFYHTPEEEIALGRTLCLLHSHSHSFSRVLLVWPT